MAKEYTPKVGDIVTAQGQNAIFKVVEVSEIIVGGIKIQPFHVGKQETFGKVMANIPRRVTLFYSKLATKLCRPERAPNATLCLTETPSSACP